MDRITGNTIDLGGGRRGFRNRNRNLALGQVGTIHNAEYHNPLQEEVLAVIEAAGLTPSGANWAQLLVALRQMFAGGMQGFTASGTFTVPAGVTRGRVRAWGGGGGGGGANGGGVPTGGSGGGYGEGVYNLTPGSGVAVTVGASGQAGLGGGSLSNGGAGGTSSFGAFLSCTGGGGGIASGGGVQSAVGAGGAVTGAQFARPGATAQSGAFVSGFIFCRPAGPHSGGATGIRT